MITNDEQINEAEKWHYIALKSARTADGFNRPRRSLPRLFRGITANNVDFYCLGFVYIHFELIMRLKDMKDYVIIMIIAMQKCPPKIIKYNHGEKSLKEPFTIYADLECLLIKEQSCQNNPNESYTERKAMKKKI